MSTVARRSSGSVAYRTDREGALGAGLMVCEAGPPKPRLLDRVREAIRARHYSRRTEKAYVHWIRRDDEVRAVLQRLDGVPRLMAILLYGAGLRLLACCRLRAQDVDVAPNQIVIRDGKRRKDRVTMLPGAIKAALSELPGALDARTRTPAGNGNGSQRP